MRVQSRKQLQLRGAVLGGPQPLVCLPLMARNSETLLAQAEQLVVLRPDIIEWRADGYERVKELDHCQRLLLELRQRIGQIPLLVTCRMAEEGGLAPISAEHRRELCLAAIASGAIDLLDCELANPPAFLDSVRRAARAKGVPLLLSYHNFHHTPDEDAILAILRQAVAAGADVVKVAVMPRVPADVLTLLRATNRARVEEVHLPLVTISMGAMGLVSRLAGGLFGSDMTFAIGLEASAPGQIPIDDLRLAMALLYQTDRST